jgi:Na+/proline symporter
VTPVIRAIINPDKVRKALFTLASVSVLACVVISILAIWDYVGNASAYKMLASCAVMVGGGVLFAILNRVFGEPIEERLDPFSRKL